MSLFCLPINKNKINNKINNTIDKIKQKLGIKYHRLSNSKDEEIDNSELDNLHNFDNLDNSDSNSDCDIHNEPLQIIQTQKKIDIPPNLTENEKRKRKILLNKVFLLFENNNFELDVYSIKKLSSDKYILLRYFEMQDPYYVCYNEQKEKLKIECLKNIETMDAYELNLKKEIYTIIRKYFVNFESLYGSNTLIHTALCGICMKHINICEYQCYTCNKTFFKKCDNETHNNTNEMLPLKKRFSNDFITHIYTCLLNNDYVINDLYEYIK